MKSVLVLTLLVVFITGNLSHALVGGGEAPQTQSQGIVGLSYKDSLKNCIGVLLQLDRVLTTAACTSDFETVFDPSDYRVHPLLGDEIGGDILLPTLNENVTPFVGVSSVVMHPNNEFRFGPYNLAVLRLSEPLGIRPVTIYSGAKSYVGEQADAFGWEAFTQQGQILRERYYAANVMRLPAIVDGDSNPDSITDGCYDSFIDTDTVFCAGYRNDSQYLESNDTGAPLFTLIGDTHVVIGLLAGSSSGIDIDGIFDYEEYARVSSMKDFILSHAPDTNFAIDLPGSDNNGADAFVPVINLLLNDD